MVLTTAATILSVGTMLLSPIPTARSEPPLGIPGVQMLTDIDILYRATLATISDDGRVIAFVSHRKGTWDVYVYDRKTRQLSRPGPLAGSDDWIGAALSGSGQFIIASYRKKAGAIKSGLSLYDRTHAKLVPLPGLSVRGEALQPAISGNGRFIAFVDETQRGPALRYEARLYDRWRQAMVPLPRLQHQFADVVEPTVDNEGRYIAFASGAGLPPHPPSSRLYLYDRQNDGLIDLPGLGTLRCSLSGISPATAGSWSSWTRGRARAARACHHTLSSTTHRARSKWPSLRSAAGRPSAPMDVSSCSFARTRSTCTIGKGRFVQHALAEDGRPIPPNVALKAGRAQPGGCAWPILGTSHRATSPPA
jgi:WD40-like Beta Propeller Repeat